MIPPLKHVIQSSQIGVNTGASDLVIDLAEGVENPDPYANFTNVRNGSLIKQMHIMVDYDDSNVNTPIVSDWYVWFNINGAQTRPVAANTNASHLKNQIFHQDGALTSLTQATSVGVTDHLIAKWRLVINIPRAFQQINLGDKIQFVFRNNNNTTLNNLKLLVIYKEIFP